VIAAINERPTSDVQSIEKAIADAIIALCGDNPLRSKLHAIVWTVRRRIETVSSSGL